MKMALETVVVLILALLVWGALADLRQWWRMTPEQRAERQKQNRIIANMRRQNETWGPQNPALVCPHCQTKGRVRVKAVQRKKGISGAKATGALLTGGVSMLATGLSRKEGSTQAHCDRCNSTWDF
jgi:uncharacterized paraquat-inducible protein A